MSERKLVPYKPEPADADVLPCPFCGERPFVEAVGDGGRALMIHCIADDCPNPSVSYYAHAVAKDVWNRRMLSQPAEGWQPRQPDGWIVIEAGEPQWGYVGDCRADLEYLIQHDSCLLDARLLPVYIGTPMRALEHDGRDA